jgi:hypothetical protein
MKNRLALLLPFTLTGCFGPYMMGDYKAPETGPVAVVQISTPQATGTLFSQVSGSSFCGKTWYLDKINIEKHGNQGALMKIEAEKPMDMTVVYSTAFQGPFCRFNFSFLPRKDAKYDIEVDAVGKYCYVRMFREDIKNGLPLRERESSFQQVYPNCSKI